MHFSDMKTITWSQRLLKGILTLIIGLGWLLESSPSAQAMPPTNWPQFGLVFQTPKDYEAAAKRFGFSWDVHGRIEQLARRNNDGIYLRYYNLTMTNPLPNWSKRVVPDYEFISKNHPEWFIQAKDGSPARWYHDKNFLYMDIGRPEYVDWVIDWIRVHAFGGGEFRGHLALDYGIFSVRPDWAKYDTNEAFRDAWEYFLRRFSEAFRPQHKIVLNIGGCDLPTFARMVQWLDGVLIEGFPPLKETILDFSAKGRWCAAHGKIWAVRYMAPIKAIRLSPKPGGPPMSISVGEGEIIVAGADPTKVLGRIDLGRPGSNTLAQVAQLLQEFNLTAEVVNPYPEAAAAGAFQSLKFAKIGGELILKLKQPPREAFLFGYAGMLMAAGPNSFYILGDERFQDYYYPEMDQPVGAPRGDLQEVAPKVFRRDFENYLAFLNLSTEAFPLPDGSSLAPQRGVLLKVKGPNSH